jgi:hypothetical protein
MVALLATLRYVSLRRNVQSRLPIETTVDTPRLQKDWKTLENWLPGDFIQRKAKDREDPNEEEGVHWLPTIFLDRLSMEIDVLIQIQVLKVMADLCTTKQTPWQINRLLDDVVNEGGGELGLKKKLCSLLLEWSSQIYYKLSFPLQNVHV